MISVDEHENIKREMSKYDSLSPAWRKLVQEYNIMPLRGESIEQYMQWVNAAYPRY